MWRLSAIQGRDSLHVFARQGGRSRILREASSVTPRKAAFASSSDVPKGCIRSRNFNRRIRYFHSSTRAWKRVSSPVGSTASWSLGDENDEDDEELDRLHTEEHNSMLQDIDPDDPDDIPDLLDHRFRSLDDDDEGAEEREQYRLQQESINDELDQRKGRPWKDPWEITEEQWMQSDTGPDSIPDWNPSMVSRIAQERLQILSVEDGKGIPTLEELKEMSFPVADPILHPARATKTYASYRKSQHFRAVQECVVKLSTERVQALLKEAASATGDKSWQNQQESVDALFEAMQEEAAVDESMDILSKHPDFGKWVERALEDYLQTAQRQQIAVDHGSTTKDKNKNENGGTPVFMDCYDPSEVKGDGKPPMVPKILHPLAPHKHGGPGRMVEEWELSAHPTTKRILLRECTSHIASLLSSADTNKIYVHGKRGTGKSTVLASIVAAARKSGNIVLYLPDGDRLRKNGFFVTPSTHPNRAGCFDLQDLSQEVLGQLEESHSQELEGIQVPKDTMEKFFKESHLQAIMDAAQDCSVVDLIKHAQENKKQAPMCYSAIVHHLMDHNSEFMVVMDEFNCLFDHGHYFHMAYDEDVREAIPLNKINLFEPILNAMGLSTKTVEQEEDEETELLQPGSTIKAKIVVGTTESHAVKSSFTEALTACAIRRLAVEVVEVPRFSSIEADHILANFEATGVGKLRLDRGDTLLNPQEVEYLKMASGSVGQKLLDISIL